MSLRMATFMQFGWMEETNPSQRVRWPFISQNHQTVETLSKQIFASLSAYARAVGRQSLLVTQVRYMLHGERFLTGTCAMSFWPLQLMAGQRFPLLKRSEKINGWFMDVLILVRL